MRQLCTEVWLSVLSLLSCNLREQLNLLDLLKGAAYADHGGIDSPVIRDGGNGSVLSWRKDKERGVVHATAPPAGLLGTDLFQRSNRLLVMAR